MTSKRYIARFQPEVWQNDYAVTVDVPCDSVDTWDVTDALMALPDADRLPLLEILDRGQGALDRDDTLLMSAPDWCQAWGSHLPFSIYINEK